MVKNRDLKEETKKLGKSQKKINGQVGNLKGVRCGLAAERVWPGALAVPLPVSAFNAFWQH